MSSRLRVAALTALTVTLPSTLAGCAALAPSPYATPEPDPVVTPTDASPDGFTPAERIALRVWAPSCDAYRKGSAWMLDATHAVTNRHVVEGATELSLTDYQGERYEVVDAAMSAADDLALLTIDGEFPRSATIADDHPRVGEEVSMSGFARGGPLKTLAGEYLYTTTDTLNADGARVYYVSIGTIEGDSGSALVDSDGHVVGVIFAGDGGTSGSAVQLNRLRAFLDDSSDREPVTADC